MSMKYDLIDPKQGHAIISTAWPTIKALLEQGEKLVLTVTKKSRTNEQNAMFHVLFTKIAKQATHMGARWTDEDWKRFLIDQWAKETHRLFSKIAPSLDGERVVQLGLQSRKFTKEEGAEFIEWVHAWAAQSGIEL